LALWGGCSSQLVLKVEIVGWGWTCKCWKDWHWAQLWGDALGNRKGKVPYSLHPFISLHFTLLTEAAVEPAGNVDVWFARHQPP
jgi:hypothetical protein